VRVVARTPVTAVACPECGQLSERMHAYYQHRLADLPVGGRPVTVDLRVRRVVCAAVSCRRRTFREQVPALTPRWARRATRCGEPGRLVRPVRVSSVLGGAGRDLQGGVRAGQVDAIVPLTWTGGASRLA